MFSGKIAHRGLHGGDIPENSMAAFSRAVDKGFAIELDVRLTRDGKLAVFHDAELERMCGVEGRLEDFTYEQLSAFRLKGSDERIPLLKDVLKLVDGKVPLLVELKDCGFPVLEKRTIRLMKNYRGEFAVQSFDPFTVMWYRLFSPDTARGQLISTYKKRLDLQYIARRICALPIVWRLISRPDFISADIRTIDEKTIKAVKECGAELFLWTIKTDKGLKKAEGLTDGIIFENYDRIKINKN